MMKFEHFQKTRTELELVIQDEDMSYTKEYIERTKDFYMSLGQYRNQPPNL